TNRRAASSFQTPPKRSHKKAQCWLLDRENCRKTAVAVNPKLKKAKKCYSRLGPAMSSRNTAGKKWSSSCTRKKFWPCWTSPKSVPDTSYRSHKSCFISLVETL